MKSNAEDRRDNRERGNDRILSLGIESIHQAYQAIPYLSQTTHYYT